MLSETELIVPVQPLVSASRWPMGTELSSEEVPQLFTPQTCSDPELLSRMTEGRSSWTAQQEL